MALFTETTETGDLLAKRVRNSIRQLGYPQLTTIECEADGSTIWLRGTIESSYLKQAVQAIAARVPGVRHVNNELEVP